MWRLPRALPSQGTWHLPVREPTVDCEWEDASSLLDDFDDPGEQCFPHRSSMRGRGTDAQVYPFNPIPARDVGGKGPPLWAHLDRPIARPADPILPRPESLPVLRGSLAEN